MVVWAEYVGGEPVALSRHAPTGPVCVLSVSTAGATVRVGFCRVTAKAHEDVLAVLAGAPASGREVARALGISPMTAIARLNDLLSWGMALARTNGRSTMWSLADSAGENAAGPYSGSTGQPSSRA